jgi:hypothetical protein
LFAGAVTVIEFNNLIDWIGSEENLEFLEKQGIEVFIPPDKTKL